MKKSIIFGALFSWLSIFPFVNAAVNLDEIVAVVNGEIITQRELNTKVSMFKKHAEISGVAAPKASELRKQALDALVDVSLQLQLAKLNNIVVSDKELDEIVANIAKSNGITVVELKESVPKMEGMSYAAFSKQLRQQITVSRLQQQALGREITVSDKDIEKIIRNPPKMSNMPVQYHLMDILIAMPDSATKSQIETIMSVAKQMLAKLKKGGDPNKIVDEVQNKLKNQIVQNNDLEWRTVSDLPELFAKEVVKMKVNQIVGPIKAPNGLHLLKLIGINSHGLQSGSLTKDQAREMVFHKKLMEKLTPWLEEQRSKAYIKIIK